MSDEEKSTSEAGEATALATEEPTPVPVGDEHTTVPNPPSVPAAPAKWSMPKPVFKQTSGYLPQGYLKDMQELARTSPDAENTTQEQSPMALPSRSAPREPDLSAINLSAPAAAAAVEPQPDLSEQLIPEEPVLTAEPEPETKSGNGKVMIVLGIVGFFVFVAIFLAVIYYLFLRGPADASPF